MKPWFGAVSYTHLDVYKRQALNMWIAGCQSTEEVQEIFYGADVPKQYRSEVLNAYLVQKATEIGVGEYGTPIAE